MSRDDKRLLRGIRYVVGWSILLSIIALAIGNAYDLVYETPSISAMIIIWFAGAIAFGLLARRKSNKEERLGMSQTPTPATREGYIHRQEKAKMRFATHTIGMSIGLGALWYGIYAMNNEFGILAGIAFVPTWLGLFIYFGFEAVLTHQTHEF
ncbi:MAG: hypothetical protein HMLIMOIP_000782 [Candidatus Nitrosomirales archaeon]|jgi:hypothetical protein